MAAESALRLLGACDPHGALTPLGRRIAQLPLDPALAVALIRSEDLGCSEDLAIAIAMLGHESRLWRRPRDQRSQAQTAHRQFFAQGSDIVTLYRVYQEWVAVPSKDHRGWCQTRFLDRRALDGARATLKEIRGALQRFGIRLTAAGDGAEVSIRRALCHGLVSQLGLARGPLRSGFYVAGSEPPRIVKVPPSSCLWLEDRPPSAIVWFELVDSPALGTLAQGATAVDMAWVHEAAPQYAAALTSSISNIPVCESIHPVASTALRRIIGKHGAALRDLEGRLGPGTALELDLDEERISVWAPATLLSSAVAQVREALHEVCSVAVSMPVPVPVPVSVLVCVWVCLCLLMRACPRLYARHALPHVVQIILYSRPPLEICTPGYRFRPHAQQV